MARIKTFANGGSLLPSDANAIEDDYEAAFALYRSLQAGTTRLDAQAAATYLLSTPGTVNLAIGGAAAGLAVFHFDPADMPVGVAGAGPRVAKLRIRAAALVNATAPATTFTLGLYPVTAAAGAAAAVSVTLGTVTAGSTAALATPAANSRTAMLGADFTAPAAGFYALGVVVAGAMAASSAIALTATLQGRLV